MASLIAAAALFLAIHVLVSGTPVRGAIVARIGERPYQGLFSLASLGAIAWMAVAYGDAETVHLWDVGAGGRHVALAIMPFACILLVGAILVPNPTAVGMDKALGSERAARGMLKVTRHPFLWGIALWALAHLLANGDSASAVLFGTMLLLALVGPLLIDAKMARRHPEEWRRFAEATSNLPLAALAARRTTLSFADIGWRPLVFGLALYAVLLGLHPFLFGVSPLSG